MHPVPPPLGVPSRHEPHQGNPCACCTAGRRCRADCERSGEIHHHNSRQQSHSRPGNQGDLHSKHASTCLTCTLGGQLLELRENPGTCAPDSGQCTHNTTACTQRPREMSRDSHAMACAAPPPLPCNRVTVGCVQEKGEAGGSMEEPRKKRKPKVPGLPTHAHIQTTPLTPGA